jgi:hypothetical protein
MQARQTLWGPSLRRQRPFPYRGYPGRWDLRKSPRERLQDRSRGNAHHACLGQLHMAVCRMSRTCTVHPSPVLLTWATRHGSYSLWPTGLWRSALSQPDDALVHVCVCRLDGVHTAERALTRNNLFSRGSMFYQRFQLIISAVIMVVFVSPVRIRTMRG